MKRVLIPTDFSGNAWNTIMYAMQLYNNIPCEFYLLNTYELKPIQLLNTVSSQRVGHFYDTIRIDSEKGLKLTLDDIKATMPQVHHTFKTVTKSGSLLSNIDQLMKSVFFDMIIIGTKGANGAKEVFIGSTTQKVISTIKNCPVLIIPEEARFQKITTLAFATDFERVYYTSEIKPIIYFAKHFDASVKMIHVKEDSVFNEVQHYNANVLEEFFKNLDYDIHTANDSTSIKNEIQKLVEKVAADLLIMINYEHSFIERLTREAVIKKMTFHTEIPFLVIPSDN